jgi:isopentenyl diphosphate isomerase/L-lactate dehydrogenase-like FMN-dependent dehydrogenase
MFDKLDTSGLVDYYTPKLTWESIRRMKDITKMKVVLKGIVTREDAELCVERGVDGIIVSNHGGRAEESGRSTIECLSEVIDAVGGKIPVLIDGGFRRGTDIFKALALGARAVCIGRPYIWGLGAFGQPGIERVLDILRMELELIMKQAGVLSLDQIKRSYLVESSR